MSAADLEDTTDRLFAAMIARLRVTSETPAATAPTIRKNAQHDGRRPRGTQSTAADRLVAAYNAATADSERRSLLMTAMKELKAVTHSPPPPVGYAERGTVAWRRKIAADTRSLRTVADDYGISHEQVRKLRQQFRKAA